MAFVREEALACLAGADAICFGYILGVRSATADCGVFVARVFEEKRKLPHLAYAVPVLPHSLEE